MLLQQFDEEGEGLRHRVGEVGGLLLDGAGVIAMVGIEQQDIKAELVVGGGLACLVMGWSSGLGFRAGVHPNCTTEGRKVGETPCAAVSDGLHCPR